jgi:hypothetical protein
MKITIETSAKNVEMANFLLGQAYSAAIQNKEFLKAFNVTEKDLEKAEKFRRSLLNAFTNGRISADLPNRITER